MAHLKHLLLFLWVGVAGSAVVDLNKRIYGGRNCGATERLYHVKIIGTNRTSATLCGGTLIHREWVLTAAHCLQAGWDIYAVLGVHPGPGQRVEVTAGSIFGDDQGGHDIMLLKLSKPSKIKPVDLPDCNKPLKKDDVVQVAGLGRYEIDEKGEKLPGSPPHLQCANIKVDDCGPKLNYPCYSNVPKEKWICLKEPNVDACQGDSGGGVIYKNMIYGVISGAGRCACTIPAVSVKVCSYMKWIEGKLRPNNGK